MRIFAALFSVCPPRGILALIHPRRPCLPTVPACQLLHACLGICCEVLSRHLPNPAGACVRACAYVLVGMHVPWTSSCSIACMHSLDHRSWLGTVILHGAHACGVLLSQLFFFFVFKKTDTVSVPLWANKYVCPRSGSLCPTPPPGLLQLLFPAPVQEGGGNYLGRTTFLRHRPWRPSCRQGRQPVIP